jgi:AcrR family transcriptional regulator
MNEVSTKERILDSAETLFAEKGFQGTSLRAITGGAGVNLASVNYHFGTKESLLQAVLERRLIPLNEIRRERIEEVRTKAHQRGTRPSVKEVLHAFVEPTLRFKESGSGAVDFIALVARSLSDPDDTVRRAFLILIMPMFQLLYGTLRESLPEVPEKVLLWRLHFVLGAFAHTMHITGGRFHSELMKTPMDIDTDTVVDMLIPFISAGMEAPWVD